MTKFFNKIKIFVIIFSLISFIGVKPSNAQVMDVVQLIQNVLSNATEFKQIAEAKGRMEAQEEQTRKRGLFGKLTAIRDSFRDLFKDGNFTIANKDPIINENLEANKKDVRAMGEEIDKQYGLDMEENPANISEKTYAIQTQYEKDNHISAVTAYGLALSTRAVLQKEKIKEEDLKEVGESPEDIRSNIKALTNLSQRTVLQLSNVKYLKAKSAEMKAFTKYRTMTLMQVVDARKAPEMSSGGGE